MGSDADAAGTSIQQVRWSVAPGERPFRQHGKRKGTENRVRAQTRRNRRFN
jgi:hypothetical protein